MFTGLIQQVGRLTAIERRGEGGRMVIDCAPWNPPLVAGESVAVQGACLTVTDLHKTSFTCDLLAETIEKTNLLSKSIGARFNLERAMRADDRFGGHFVSGHVDGIGRVESIDRVGPDWAVTLECAPELMQGIVPKGSVACDGVSLTVAAIQSGTFIVHLIPFTWEHTSLGTLAAGDTINIETDMIGKYVLRYSAVLQRNRPELTMDDLRDAGFLD